MVLFWCIVSSAQQTVPHIALRISRLLGAALREVSKACKHQAAKNNNS